MCSWSNSIEPAERRRCHVQGLHPTLLRADLISVFSLGTRPLREGLVPRLTCIVDLTDSNMYIQQTVLKNDWVNSENVLYASSTVYPALTDLSRCSTSSPTRGAQSLSAICRGILNCNSTRPTASSGRRVPVGPSWMTFATREKCLTEKEAT